SSVMFFSFSSAIVIVTYGICSWGLIWEDKRKIDSEARTHGLGKPEDPPGALARRDFRGKSIMQPDAGVRQLRSPVQPILSPAAPPPHAPGHHSWSPAHGYSACGTSASPWTPTGTGDSGCSRCQARHK